MKTSSETSVWLDVVTKSHGSYFVNEGLFNDNLILNVIDEVEGIVVGSSNSEHL